MEEIIKLAEKGNFQVRHFETWQEYMEDSAKRLFQNGNVTDGFLTALVEREKKYPTGLQTMSIAAALPHAEFQYVKTELIDITVFEKPVLFHQMDEPEQEIKVEAAFMLLLKEPHAHLKALQELMELFQSEHFPEIRAVREKKGLLNLLKEVEPC